MSFSFSKVFQRKKTKGTRVAPVGNGSIILYLLVPFVVLLLACFLGYIRCATQQLELHPHS